MKIAVISDIHGNMEALNAVFSDINEQGCEKYFVLGDYAMAGPEPNAVVDFFREKILDENFYMIQGNTDMMISNYTDSLYDELKAKAPVMAEAFKNDFINLSSPQINFLQSLPANMELEFEGVKFLLVHGSPRKNNEDILPNTPMAEVEKMLEGVGADTVLCGHTHIPCGFQLPNKKTVVNAGSVGRPFTQEPKACYLVVDVWQGRCVFEHRFIEYDKITASQKLAKRNFKGAEKLAKTLLNPKERHF